MASCFLSSGSLDVVKNVVRTKSGTLGAETKQKLNKQKRARGNIFLTIYFFFFHTHILLHPSSNSRGVQGTAYHTQPEWYTLLTKLLGTY